MNTTERADAQRIIDALIRYHNTVDACLVADRPPADLSESARRTTDELRKWERDVSNGEKPGLPPWCVAGARLQHEARDVVERLADAHSDLAQWRLDFRELGQTLWEVAELSRSNAQESLDRAFGLAQTAARLAQRLGDKLDREQPLASFTPDRTIDSNKLASIAAQLRRIPAQMQAAIRSRKGNSAGEAGTVAGRLLVQAIEAGALSDNSDMLLAVERSMATEPDAMKYGRAFFGAARVLLNRPDGRATELVADGCPAIADCIQRLLDDAESQAHVKRRAREAVTAADSVASVFYESPSTKWLGAWAYAGERAEKLGAEEFDLAGDFLDEIESEIEKECNEPLLNGDPNHPNSKRWHGHRSLWLIFWTRACSGTIQDNPQAVDYAKRWGDTLDRLDAERGLVRRLIERLRKSWPGLARRLYAADPLAAIETLQNVGSPVQVSRSESATVTLATATWFQPIDEYDASILEFLNRRPNLRRKVTDVVPDYGPQDRKAVAARLRKLADRTPALVDYPKGGRSGVAILPAGIEALTRAQTPR